MAETINGSLGSVLGVPSAGAVGYVGTPDTPTLDLLTVETDGPTGLVLTFSRPPAGPVTDPSSYTLAALGDGVVPAVVAAAVSGEGQYPTSVHLTLEHQATGNATYRVTVAGLTGPCGEVLGVASRTWVAVAVAPRVTGAVEYDGEIQVGFDSLMDIYSFGVPDDWTLVGDVALPTITGFTALPGGRGVSLRVSGPVLDGTTVTAPAEALDVGGNAIDPAGRSTLVGAGLAAPVIDAEDGEQSFLWVTLNGEPLDHPWSPLPDDPTDQDEILARTILTILGTDRRAGADDVTASDYRGGCWSDSFCPERLSSRVWMLVGAPATDDTLARAEQYIPEDLAPLVSLGLLASVSCSATYEADDMRLILTVSVTAPDGRDFSLSMGVRR